MLYVLKRLNLSMQQSSSKTRMQTYLEVVVRVKHHSSVLCGDGFMDFTHRPKSKILKILKN
jgi:hypothetical protein